MSVTSEPIEPIVINSFDDVLQSIYADRVTAGGHRGYFLKESSLKAGEKAFWRIMKQTSDNMSEEEISKMRDSMDEIRADYSKAKAALKAQEFNTTDLKRSLDEARKSLAAASLEGPQSTKVLKEQAVEYRRQLDSLQKQLGEAKIATAAAKRSNDPTAGEAAVWEETGLRASVKALQKEREVLDRKVAQNNKIEAEQKAKIAKLELEHIDSAKELASLKSKQAAANKHHKLEEVDFSINVPLVSALIGKKGLDILRKIDLRRRENLRDYAYDLMQAVNSTSNTRGLGQLLYMALQWMKEKTYAAREALRPWLSKIHTDLLNGSVAAMRVYREQLQAISEDFKKAKKDTRNARPNDNTFVHNAFTSLAFLKNRYEQGSLFSRIYKGVTSSWAFAKKKSITLYHSFVSMLYYQPQTVSEESEILLYDYDNNKDSTQSEPYGTRAASKRPEGK